MKRHLFEPVLLCLLLSGAYVPAAESDVLRELARPSAETVAAAKDLPIPKTDTHPVDWANPGSLGPTGLIAQRFLKRLEYKVLAVENGSPARGRMLPGDVVIGVDGKLFQPEDYSKEDKSVARYKRYMEPNPAFGRALESAAAKQKGRLVLSVRRGGREGTVTLQLPSRQGFSATYPWNCPKSAQVAEEIAARFAKEALPYRRDLYATAWYGLFLLNHDPIKYRGKIDEIVQLVIRQLPRIRSGSHLRGFGGGANVWHTALYGLFLAEYAMITEQQTVLRPHLNLLADLLYDVRMVGNLWGHTKWHNYGTINGGFVAASSQVGLALLCLKEAGAAIHDTALARVMDALSASINRDSGHVGYGSPDNGSARQPFNWQAIRANQSQLGSESLMRQGTVQLAMLLSGRTDEVRATGHFMERMILCHATHGIAPDWGILDASRAAASTDPAVCRKLLDAVRYRLNLCLRWDGGIQLVPYRNRRGEEYGVDTFRADRYVPAMWGLVLSMPRKRLFLLSKVAEPGTEVKRPASKAKLLPDALNVRHLTCGGGKAYFAAPDGPTNWGVYQHDPGSGTTRLLRGALPYPPQELVFWKRKLYFSVRGASLWVWDGDKALELQSIKRSRKAAAQFTPFADVLYFVSPPSGKEKSGGELWKTDGTKMGTVKVMDGLWMLQGGSGHWQTDMAHAQSLQVALGKLFFATCETERNGMPMFETFALWASDGTAKGTVKLATQRLAVLAVDHHNAPRGSFLGLAYHEKLFFCADRKLWESDGTPAGTRESPLRVRSPNNFSLFRDKLLLSGRRSGKKGRKGGLELISTDGSVAGTRNFTPPVRDLRQITASGDKCFFFVGNDGQTGDELWVSDGTVENTRLVREARPGPCGGVIDQLVNLRGQLYFAAGDDVRGSELWRTEGGANGTQVADLLPGPEGSLPGQLRVSDGRLFFYTTAIVEGRQLWCHDPARSRLTFTRP